MKSKSCQKTKQNGRIIFNSSHFSSTQSENWLSWWNFHRVINRSKSGSGQTPPSSSINVEITFLITFIIIQSQICLHKQRVQAIQPSSGTLQPTKYNSCIYTKGYIIINHNTGRSCFMPGLHSCKTLCKWNTKFPFKTKYSWGLADWQPHHIYCMTIPLVNIWTWRICMYRIYSTYVYLHTVYICFYTTYLFISIAIKLLETHTHSFWYRSFQ